MKPDALSIHHAITPGAILGGYRVVAPLSKGGMGSVFIAEHQKTGHTRALKVMHPSLAENPKAVQRFEQEAKIGARIESDHVVHVLDAGVDPHTGIPWLAMELLKGQELSARMAAGSCTAPRADDAACTI